MGSPALSILAVGLATTTVDSRRKKLVGVGQSATETSVDFESLFAHKLASCLLGSIDRAHCTLLQLQNNVQSLPSTAIDIVSKYVAFLFFLKDFFLILF